MPSTRYSFGMPILHALDRLCRPRPRSPAPATVGRGGVLRIVAGHRAQHDRGVAHRARERPGLVERGGERDDPPARAAAVGRLDADDAGERGRLADRAAGVGAGRAERRAAPPPPRPSRPTSRRAPAACWRPCAATARSPGRRTRSRSTSPWRTRRCWSCRAAPRRRARAARVTVDS